MADPISDAISQEASSVGGEILGAAQLYSGIKNLKQDKADLSNLRRPFYKIQDEYIQNKNISEAQAGDGLGAATKDYYTNESGRGLNSSVSALLQGGGDMNMISSLFDKYNRSTAGLAAEDAQAHQKNIQYFQQSNRDLAGQKTTQFVVNELQPYENKLKELTQRVAADKANEWGGAQTIVGSALGSGGGPPKGGGGASAQSDPYITPSKVSSTLQSTGDMSVDTSRALASFLSNSGPSINIGG
jgi:hypothetical protein